MAYTRTNSRKRKQAVKARKKLHIIVLGIILLVVAVVGSLYFPFWQIKEIVVTGNETVQTGEIISIARKGTQGQRALVLPRSNIIVFSQDELVDELLEIHPKIQKLTIEKKGLSKVQIIVIERQVSEVLCHENGCLRVDPEGYVFEGILKELAPEHVYISNKEYVLRDTFLSQEILQELARLRDSLQGRGLDIVETNESSPFTFVLETSKGLKLIIPKQKNYDELYSAFVKLLSQPEFVINKNTRDFSQDIAYINLSFGNKIFYCQAGAVCASNY